MRSAGQTAGQTAGQPASPTAALALAALVAVLTVGAPVAAGAASPSQPSPSRDRADAGATVAIPPPIASLLPEARLAGEGAMRWFGFEVYTARLWVGNEGLPATRFDAAPFALDLRYAMSLAGPAIAERSVQEIERLGLGDTPRRERWHETLRRLFPDVARADRLTGVFQPGRGAAFFHNDRPLGEIADPELASAFFAIWLDERTVAPALRRALLARAGTGAARR